MSSPWQSCLLAHPLHVKMSDNAGAVVDENETDGVEGTLEPIICDVEIEVKKPEKWINTGDVRRVKQILDV